MRVIISGGGSGGHIFPAIAIANELKEKIKDVEILFVGAEGKMEMNLVPKAGYKIEGLNVRGLQRKLTIKNLSFPFRLLGSLRKAKKILRSFKPDIVIGVGGYASGPMLHVSAKAKIPTLIQEQNSYAGLTNKLLAKKVDRICVAYDGMDKFFPKEKIVLTGNPVRSSLTGEKISKNQAYNHFGLDQNKKTVLSIGGSLGARTLNAAFKNNVDILSNEGKDINFIWQVGRLYYEVYSQTKTAQLENVYPLPFIDRMDLAYAAADLVVCRAGALTISELCNMGHSAILVPSPNVAEDHQTMNAMALVEKEAAIMVHDEEVSAELFPSAIKLVDDEQRLLSLSANVKQMARPNAVQQIVSEIIKLTQR